jgi:hypothetical protein
VVRFSDVELSSDAGILLARQAEEQVQVCRGLSECIQDWRDPNKIIHSLHQLVSQRVYQLVGGYEDANDSNVLRHDPIIKIACGRSPSAGTDLLDRRMGFVPQPITKPTHLNPMPFNYCFVSGFPSVNPRYHYWAD